MVLTGPVWLVLLWCQFTPPASSVHECHIFIVELTAFAFPAVFSIKICENALSANL